ncbi:OBSCN-AS1 isoform 1 [Pongo abelii]|uniref:OBSCN-AS1 isoform 1 n=2 Tax=Pongo abelii TaxID=9601 RepID=A0A2J8U1U3_PONAB|nr:OBSCN-AS1 isoform 1 [Pongo abelii]
MYTASSSAETLRTVRRRSVPSSSMPYLALAHNRVSSLNHAASVDGWDTSHRNVADSFSRTSRSCSRFLKGTAGSARRGDWRKEGFHSLLNVRREGIFHP